MTFRERHEKFMRGYKTVDPTEISFIIWLIENPMSPFHLHGSASLRDHDAIHVLLECGQTNDDEAFVIGFTMGTDDRIKSWEVKAFKFISQFLYPRKTRFTKQQIEIFDKGFAYGLKRSVTWTAPTICKRIGEFDWTKVNWDSPFEKVQEEFGILGNELRFFKGEVY